MKKFLNVVIWIFGVVTAFLWGIISGALINEINGNSLSNLCACGPVELVARTLPGDSVPVPVHVSGDTYTQLPDGSVERVRSFPPSERPTYLKEVVTEPGGNEAVEAIKTDEMTIDLPDGGKQVTLMFWTKYGPIYWVREDEE